MAFTTLVPKDVLLSYVNTVMHYKKVMLHGPSGTGKSFLAQRLENSLILTCVLTNVLIKSLSN